MTYYGNCARCNSTRNSVAFKSAKNGKPIPPYAAAADVPHRSTINTRLCTACRLFIEKKRPPLIDLTLSHAEKLQTGENMRRLVTQDGEDGFVTLPSTRGPSTTWYKLTTPRVGNECAAAILARSD